MKNEWNWMLDPKPQGDEEKQRTHENLQNVYANSVPPAYRQIPRGASRHLSVTRGIEIRNK